MRKVSEEARHTRALYTRGLLPPKSYYLEWEFMAPMRSTSTSHLTGRQVSQGVCGGVDVRVCVCVKNDSEEGRCGSVSVCGV